MLHVVPSQISQAAFPVGELIPYPSRTTSYNLSELLGLLSPAIPKKDGFHEGDHIFIRTRQPQEGWVKVRVIRTEDAEAPNSFLILYEDGSGNIKSSHARTAGFGYDFAYDICRALDEEALAALLGITLPASEEKVA